jgi:hypothetical protein
VFRLASHINKAVAHRLIAEFHNKSPTLVITVKMQFLTFLALLASVCSSFAATPDEWRSRSIYQIVTDRFARTDGSTTAACNAGLGQYCGGTWNGIANQLDYIQGMGFDAVRTLQLIVHVWATANRQRSGYLQSHTRSPKSQQISQHTMDIGNKISTESIPHSAPRMI